MLDMRIGRLLVTVTDKKILLLEFPRPRQQLEQVDPVLVEDVFSDIIKRQQPFELAVVGVVGKSGKHQSDSTKPTYPLSAVFIDIGANIGTLIHWLVSVRSRRVGELTQTTMLSNERWLPRQCWVICRVEIAA
ncbi:hypothetical protein C472_03793 [Halorubrum tebenquichense DSM 14210]|uniref:Uncharacterized protein n=1 Tax=Halorubrum tebenquichense DSM 14210 TaxID=1227485 RepID=M0DX63_9EURY|nr:hypothetical protein C472_03793 [Halorubrum tebenquichense DSM 14210]